MCSSVIPSLTLYFAAFPCCMLIKCPIVSFWNSNNSGKNRNKKGVNILGFIRCLFNANILTFRVSNDSVRCDFSLFELTLFKKKSTYVSYICAQTSHRWRCHAVWRMFVTMKTRARVKGSCQSRNLCDSCKWLARSAPCSNYLNGLIQNLFIVESVN